jgi:hypothetical protein
MRSHSGLVLTGQLGDVMFVIFTDGRADVDLFMDALTRKNSNDKSYGFPIICSGGSPMPEGLSTQEKKPKPSQPKTTETPPKGGEKAGASDGAPAH